MSSVDQVPEPFKSAIQTVHGLERHDKYFGAFVFGSVARGDQNENSDLDIKVITNRKTYCKNVNHPFINGVKLELIQNINITKEFWITFQSQLEIGKI